jgi:hypothetical protein
LLLALALSGPGCLSSGTHVEKEARQTPPVRMPEAPPPPVTADQVTETNAFDSAQALAREMDSESNSRPAALAQTEVNTLKP